MAESRPAGQIEGQEATAQAVEAGTGIGKRIGTLCRDGVRRPKAHLELNFNAIDKWCPSGGHSGTDAV